MCVYVIDIYKDRIKPEKNFIHYSVLPTKYLDKIRKKEVKNIQRKIKQLNIKEDEILFATV